MKKIYLSIFISISLIVSSQNTEKLNSDTWDISNGIIQTDNNPKDVLANKYWNYLKNVLPSKMLTKYVFSLRLTSDGEHEDLAGMTPLNDENSKWEIDIDTLDFNFNNKNLRHVQNYTHTIIHEFGHLLTLNPEQVTITEDEYQKDEKGYLTSEGYADQDSYLGKYVNQFWNGRLLRKWDKIDKIRSQRRKSNSLYKFYLKNQNQFLTDYAAESPEEDIAESWTFFVLSDKPTKDSIKTEKVLFFYQFPELVDYRNEIRSKLNTIPINYIN